MMPADWLRDETRAWFQRGVSDLRAAEICSGELPAEALYHCQQAAEKFLKAFLTWHRTTFRKTHELRELAMACVVIDATLEATLEPAAVLSQYAWKFRYPGAPYEPDTDEAMQGRAMAELVRSEIETRLPQLRS